MDKKEAILLALESEWNYNPADVGYDFSKPFAVKVPIPIMLFEDLNENPDYVAALDYLGQRWLQHAEGDTFYAINFGRARHDTWFYKTQSSGQIASTSPK